MCRLRAVSPFFRFSDGSASAHERRAACRKKRGRLASSITHMVICVSHEYCSMDQEKRESARSLHVCKAKPENFCSLRFHLDNQWSCLANKSNLNTRKNRLNAAVTTIVVWIISKDYKKMYLFFWALSRLFQLWRSALQQFDFLKSVLKKSVNTKKYLR